MQKDLMIQINKVESNLNKEGSRRTLISLNNRQISLHEKWSEFKQNHREIVMLPNLNKNIKYFNEEYLDQTEENVMRISESIQNYKIQLTPIEQTSQDQQQQGPHNISDISETLLRQLLHNQTNNQTNEIRLPNISIPKFVGDYYKWTPFYDLFNSMIHTKPNLSGVQKFHYLKTNLSGEALQLIDHLQITDANYAAAWKSLVDRYQNRRLLVNSHINNLFNLPISKEASATSIKNLVDKTQECLNALNNLNLSTKDWDPLIVYIITQRIDSGTHLLWEQSLENPRELPTLKTLITFLETRFQTLEIIQNNSLNFRNDPLQDNHNIRAYSTNKNSNNKGGSSKQHQRMSCQYCNTDNHNTFKCASFMKLSEANRLKWAQQSSRCVNCLRAGHNVYSCTSKNKCSVCKKNHHTLLHLQKQPIEYQNREQHSSSCNMLRTQPHELLENTQPSTETTNFNHKFTSQQCPMTSQSQPSTSNSSSSSTQLHQISDDCQAHPCRNNTLTQSSSVINSHFINSMQQHQLSNVILLATAIIKIADKYGVLHKFRALIDQGSEASFITESAAQILSLPKIKRAVTISGIGNNEQKITKSLNIDILSTYNQKFKTTITVFILPHITSKIPSVQANHIWDHLNNIQLADPLFYMPSKIDILLGSDVYNEIILSGLRKGSNNSPIAQHTELGWVVSGATKQNHNYSPKQSYHIKLEENVDVLLKRFWEIEELNEKTSYTKEESLCEDIFEKTHKRNLDGSYTVSLPFNPNCDAVLGRSRDRAVARLLSMEKTFARKPELFKQYNEFMSEYINLGHAKLDSPLETTTCERHQYYLPHQAVIRETSSTTKLRVVFDASSKSSTGVSLNDQLLTGPTIQSTLFSIIMKWRKYKVAITADVEKMYRQIKINDADHNYQRIVWRSSPTQRINEYQLRTVTYGTSAAPYLAIKTLHTLAKDDQKLYPKASLVALNDFYVDDMMSGADTEEEVISLKNELCGLFTNGGFRLRKWMSNSSKVLQSISEHDRELQVPLEINSTEHIKTLGIHWDPIEDCFSFRVITPKISTKVTKREILSLTAKLFDPIGWLAPSIIMFKILLQRLWLEGISWDDEISDSLKQYWYKIVNDLPQLENIKISRWIFYISEQSTIEIHGFCDASMQAYAAVMYARVIDENGKIHSTLLTAKTRVAPTKALSIPRLELCGAVLLTELAVKTLDALSINKSALTLWSDSTIVLSWIKNNPSKYKPFVSNRISEIQNQCNASSWKYVPSGENSADCATRGVHPSLLKDHPLWWNGPHWLNKPRSSWIMHDFENSNDIESEVKSIRAFTVKQQSNIMDIIDNYSSWTTLCRVFAYCRRVKDNFLNKINKNVGPLSSEEIHNAMVFIIRNVQSNYYQAEMKCLKNNQQLSKHSKLLCFNPIMDKDNLIRVGGRIQNSQLNYSRKHPVIIPPKCHITNLIIRKHHLETLHGGTQLTLCHIRESFWIPNGRNTVRNQLAKCVRCFRFKTSVQTQLMGNLPASRVNISRPFTNTGIDYAGPVKIRVSKGRGNKTYKGYISIFVCLATKAIHLEVVSDLTTDAFLAALYRFIGRRGLCKHIYSDNGTTFVGADRLLKADRNKYLAQYQNTVQNETASKGITWHFIPPASPNFGGLWEAGVKSMKYHLKRILGDTTLTYEEFSTTLIKIESCLNSRPLCPLTEDPEDFEMLTPGHFLIGSALLAAPQPDVEDKHMSSLKRWQLTNKFHQQFWKMWHKDYINMLQQRPKKYSSKGLQLKINDVVLLREDNTPPSRWNLGRIIQIHPGADDITRVATIKTGNGIFKRSIQKICILPIEDNNPSPPNLNR